MLYKYGVEDMAFNELNFEFVKEYEFYLKTVKNNANNTALKYITDFKKIALIALDKEFLVTDSFKLLKCRKIKVPKKPLAGFAGTAGKTQVFYRSSRSSQRCLCFSMLLILSVPISKKVFTESNGF